jgi:hypothetical protein
MINPKFFPTVQAVICILACVIYLYHGLANWRMILYWGAAAVITTVVTW